MHKYLKKKLPWYDQWHQNWIHGPSHWVVFAFAITVFSGLFMYVVQSGTEIKFIDTASAQAVTQFYVDGINGNDNNDGRSTNSAWKTLAKANTNHTSCSTVNILPGEYRESIFPKAGSAGCRTVFQGLGTRADIKIIGSNAVGDWSQYSGNIYLASFRNNAAPRCDNGTRDTDCWEDRSKWLTRVNSLDLVNGPGKYYYSYTNGEVYLWTSDSQPPASHTIECSARKTAPLYSTQTADQPAGYVAPADFTIQNLTIMQSYDDGITFGRSNVTIANNDIGFNSGGGSCASNPSGIIHHKTSPLATGIVISGNYVHDQGSDDGPASLTSILGHSGSGIELYSVNGALVENNTVTKVSEALYVKSGNQPECYRNVLIQNNIAHNVASGVIFYNGGSGNTSSGTVVGNLLYDISEKSIITLNDNSGVYAYNNTIWDSQGIAIEKFGSPGENFTIKNNIISNVTTFWEPIGFLGLWWNTRTTMQSDNNIFWTTQSAFGVTDADASNSGAVTQSYASLAAWRSGTGLDAHSQNVNPLFTSTATSNFTLLAGSPAIDAGTVIAGVHCAQSDDQSPNQTGCRHWWGSAPDLGAIEYGSAASCIEQWSCGSWSECNGAQTRTCTDINNCGTTVFRPALSQTCVAPDKTSPARITNLLAL